MHAKGITLVIIGGGGASGPSSRRGGKHKKKGYPKMIIIPVSALSGSNEGGESMTPEVGDSIQLENVMGSVKTIEGGMAHVEIQSVNGEAVEYAEKEGGAREEMLDMAMEADEEAGYEE